MRQLQHFGIGPDIFSRNGVKGKMLDKIIRTDTTDPDMQVLTSKNINEMQKLRVEYEQEKRKINPLTQPHILTIISPSHSKETLINVNTGASRTLDLNRDKRFSGFIDGLMQTRREGKDMITQGEERNSPDAFKIINRWNK